MRTAHEHGAQRAAHLDGRELRAGPVRGPTGEYPAGGQARARRGRAGRAGALTDAEALDEALASPTEPLLIQDYIPGQDFCLTALYDQGRRLASAAYRNLSQFPRGAGAGVLRETVDDRPFLATADSPVRPARLDRGGRGRFPLGRDARAVPDRGQSALLGGLFHTVESGVDFPWMLYELAVTGQVATPAAPKLGQRTKVGGASPPLRDPGGRRLRRGVRGPAGGLGPIRPPLPIRTAAGRLARARARASGQVWISAAPPSA